MKQTFLADFHVHTNMSDGQLALAHVIDMYGKRNFGCIAITDHIAEESTLIGKAAMVLNKVLTRETFPAYRAAVQAEAQRAWDQYEMLVLTGFELSKNSISNHRSAHILGLGIEQYIPADSDVSELVDKIHAQNGVAIAAHPVNTRRMEKQTYHLWDRRNELRTKFDAWEVASGQFLFPEVADEGLPIIASGDVHIARQIHSWKTQLHCELKPEAILDCIRRQQVRPFYYSE